jgi:hypothetical protein
VRLVRDRLRAVRFHDPLQTGEEGRERSNRTSFVSPSKSRKERLLVATRPAILASMLDSVTRL